MATERGTPPASLPYSPQLDGLRAVAVAAVAWSHWLPQWQFGVPFGAGVHLFFVLSGFLITRILLDLRDSAHRTRAVARFYVRRALRLFPAFFLVLGVAAYADVPLVRQTWPWHAAYLSNVFIAWQGEWQGHVSHFWSLAVEEQFYLLWPWLVVFVPRRTLPVAIAAALLAGPLSHLVAAGLGLGEPFWALVPGGSADSLAIGAWLAWSAKARPGSTPWPARASVAAVAAAAWLALAVFERWMALPNTIAVWRQVLQAVVFGAIVWQASRGMGGVAGRLLDHPAAVAVGRISYGVYLVHAFAPVVVFATLRALQAEAWAPAAPLPRAALYAVTTLLLAAVMWRLVERPALALKSRVPYVTR